MHLMQGYYGIILLVSIGFGIACSLSYLIKKRYFESLIIFATYIFPPYIFSVAQSPIASLLTNLSLGTNNNQNIVMAKVILSPLISFWVIWLFFGGFLLANDDVDLINYLKNHFRKRYIRSKIVGFSLMGFGLLLFFVPTVYIKPSIWRMPFFILALLAYYTGAICVAIPDDSTKKIDNLIDRIKNSS